MVKYLRESILDDIGGTGVAWADITEDQDEAQQLRWTNEELTTFINEALRTAYRSAMLVKEENALFDISLIGGTHTYQLHESILEILDMFYDVDNKQLVKIELEDIIDSNPKWRSESGRPTSYIVDYNTGTIRFYPEPDVAEDIHIFATRLPLTELSWELAETDSPELSSKYDIAIIYYGAYLAYMKDEANSFDPQRAEYFRQLYEREFGHLSHYGSTRRSRTRNKSIAYGGI